MESNSMVVSMDEYTTTGPKLFTCDFKIKLLSCARSDNNKHNIIEIVYSNHHHIVFCYILSPLVTKCSMKREHNLSNFYCYRICDNRDIFTTAALLKITTLTNNCCGYETSSLPFIFMPAFDQSNHHDHRMLQDSIVEEAAVLPIPSFDEMYTVGEVIGDGGCAVVRAGYRIEDRARVAIKVFDCKHIDQKRKESIRSEYNILTSLNHDGVVRAMGMYEEPDYIYLVMEYVEGGDLLDRIIAKECYLEGEAKALMLHLLETVKYLHDNGIVHGDLKPDNILLRSIESDSSIKLADFGFAYSTEAPSSCNGQRGTPAYIAPEILQHRAFGLPIDMWACGVVLYALLSGYVPFHHPDQDVLFNRIRHGKFIFHHEYWSHISNEAKAFIRQLLVVDPSKRLTVNQALQHPWLQET